MAQKLNLLDLIDSEKVLELTFQHPKLKVTKRTKKLPKVEEALKIVEKTVALETARTVAEQIIPAMETMYLNYTLMNGEYGDLRADETGEWEAGLDDQVENLIKAYTPYLSADWLGNHTIACGIHEDDGISKFCMSLGKEMHKQLTYKKTPAKILSNAGITQKEVQVWLDDHIKLNKEGTEPMDENNDELEAVLHKIKAHIGEGYDAMAVFDDLDLVSDEDEVLAQGAAPRLGVEKDEVRLLQAVRLEHEENTPDMLFERIKELKAPAKDKKKSTKKAAPKKKVAKKKEVVSGGEVVGETLNPDILFNLKEYGGAKDTEMAKAVGVSRATYNNWIKGKGSLDLDFDQKTTIRDKLVEHANGLLEAIGLLDEEEPIVIE